MPRRVWTGPEAPIPDIQIRVGSALPPSRPRLMLPQAGRGVGSRRQAVLRNSAVRLCDGSECLSGSPVGGWLTFVFVRGDGDNTETLTLLFERNRAEIVRETARSLGVAAPELDPNLVRAVPIDSEQALTIAEAEIGQTFRAKCLRNRHVARLTFHPTARPPALHG